ncbi:MAG: hypothetical protein RI967_1738 [Planctomycetota bacterium]
MRSALRLAVPPFVLGLATLAPAAAQEDGARAAQAGDARAEERGADAAPAPAIAIDDALRLAVVRHEAAIAAAAYARALESAKVLRASIAAFCAAPDEALLARARANWIAARRDYGRTEVHRFGGGPIDRPRGGVETFVNAWPVDEAYIDRVDGAAGAGIIGTPAKYPILGRAVLRLHNQRGGETNVCTGWHAIEFLLWGQDRSETGPGDRPASDFVDGGAPFADRRREYLAEIADLLVEDLAKVADQWRAAEGERPAGAHRAAFEGEPRDALGREPRDARERDPRKSLEAILTGVSLLTAFEMSGERLAVAIETGDQEEEHSCFSDTTHLDFLANIEGVAKVVRGDGGPGLLALARAEAPAQAEPVERALARAEQAIAAMPAPFDQAIRAPEGSPERAKLVEALESIEALGEAIGALARALGFDLPTEPNG